MKNDKPKFSAAYHAVPAKLVTTKGFEVRVKLRVALVSYLTSREQSRFVGDATAAGLLAQELAFLVTVKSGWGPTQNEVEGCAKNLVDGYLAHADALAAAGFPAPERAALASLKDFEFGL